MNFLETVGLIAFLLLIGWLVGFIWKPKTRAGRKAFTFIVIIIAFSIISWGDNIFHFQPNPTPTRTPYSTYTPYVTPRPLSTPTSYYAEPDCYLWSQITPAMNGQELCVYGKVHQVYSTKETWTRIKFTDLPNTFFLYSTHYTYSDTTGRSLSPGDCIQVTGQVQLIQSVPYIDIGETIPTNCNP